jgi:hypothetical protein
MALTCGPLRERELLKSLAKKEYFHQYAFNYRLILDLCERISPAKALLGCGELFEVYSLRCGSDKVVQFLSKCLSSSNLVASRDSIGQIVQMFIIPFWFYCITMVHTLYKKYGHQLFMLTLTLQFHGLSRFGLNVLGLCGASSTIRTFDRWRTALLHRYDLQIQSIIETKTFCWSWDNYSHFYRNAKLTSKRTFLSSNANYTVMGLSVMQTQVDMRIQSDADGYVVDAIPSCKVDLKVYIAPVVEWIVETFLQINSQLSAPYRYWEIAKEVHNPSGAIPLMLNPNRNAEDEEVRNNARLTNYQPIGASADNSSSTEGHANLVAQFLERTRPVVERLDYIPLRVDIAIFKFFLMVCFCLFLLIDFSPCGHQCQYLQITFDLSSQFSNSFIRFSTCTIASGVYQNFFIHFLRLFYTVGMGVPRYYCFFLTLL